MCLEVKVIIIFIIMSVVVAWGKTAVDYNVVKAQNAEAISAFENC